MPRSTQKRSDAAKTGDANSPPLPSSAEGTPTRTTPGPATEPADDEPTQQPAATKLPVRARHSSKKTAFEVLARRASDNGRAGAPDDDDDDDVVVVLDSSPEEAAALGLPDVSTPLSSGKKNVEKRENKKQGVIVIEDSDSESEQEFHDADEEKKPCHLHAPAEAAEPDAPIWEEEKEEEEDAIGQEEATMAPSSSDKKKMRIDKKKKAPMDPSQSPPAAAAALAEATTIAAAPKATKIVFDEDYDFSVATKKAKSTAPVPETSKAASEAEDDDDDEDEDEAPEDEDIQKGPTRADLAKKAALKAAGQKSVAQKRKRQERDALFKRQAEEKKRATLAAPSPSNPMDMDMDMDTSRPGRKRYDRLNIPDILPPELLTDDSEPDDSDDDDGGGRDTLLSSGPPPAKRAKKITFEDADRELREESRKGTRDERVGDTVFRVSRSRQGKDELALPPRIARKWSVHHKHRLLTRHRAGVATSVYASVKKRNGFFKKKSS